MTIFRSVGADYPYGHGPQGDVRRIFNLCEVCEIAVKLTHRVRLKLMIYMDGTRRAEISTGLAVAITLKKDQGTNILTQGFVKDILTSSAVHSRGIKVRLTTGEVGRVQVIVE